MTSPPSDLAGLLDELVGLVAPADAAAVAELVRRRAAGVFRVLVVGEAKRGKSTVVNALLGRPVLPTGVLPLTAVATTVGYGRPEDVAVSYRTGGRERVPLSRLAEFVTEAGNPGNVRGVAGVEVRLDVPLLAGGLELVDTPGTGSVHEHNTGAAVAALERMDAAIVVLSADPPISAAERAWLRTVREQAVHLFCVVNKADHLAPVELAQVLEFTRAVLAEELGTEVAVWPVSARSVLAGAGSAGWAGFVAAFDGYLARGQRTELDRSVAARAARLATGAAEQAGATLAALVLSRDDLDARVAQFRARVGEVEQDRFASTALLRATVERLQHETDAAGAALQRSAAPLLTAEVTGHVAALRGGAAQVEQEALAFAIDQIRAVLEPWRAERAAVLEAAVAELDLRLRRRLDEQVTAVRRSAGDLFALDLVELPDAGRLAAVDGFGYSSGPDVGPTEALAAAVRARTPGAWGRRRVERYVLQRAAELLDRHVGRACAELRQQLAETRRVLPPGLDRRFAAGAGWITGVLDRAIALRSGQKTSVAAARTAAEKRRGAALALVGRLRRHADQPAPRLEPDPSWPSREA